MRRTTWTFHALALLCLLVLVAVSSHFLANHLPAPRKTKGKGALVSLYPVPLTREDLLFSAHVLRNSRLVRWSIDPSVGRILVEESQAVQVRKRLASELLPQDLPSPSTPFQAGPEILASLPGLELVDDQVLALAYELPRGRKTSIASDIRRVEKMCFAFAMVPPAIRLVGGDTYGITIDSERGRVEDARRTEEQILRGVNAELEREFSGRFLFRVWIDLGDSPTEKTRGRSGHEIETEVHATLLTDNLAPEQVKRVIRAVAAKSQFERRSNLESDNTAWSQAFNEGSQP